MDHLLYYGQSSIVEEMVKVMTTAVIHDIIYYCLSFIFQVFTYLHITTSLYFYDIHIKLKLESPRRFSSHDICNDIIIWEDKS